MYEDVALVILFLSCITTFLTVVVRVYNWGDLVAAENRAARLLLWLAFSDFLAAFTWVLENKFPSYCPHFMVFKYLGFTASCFLTNCIGVQLVANIQVKRVPERLYYLVSFVIPIIMASVWFCLHYYKKTPAPVNCWFSAYKYDLIMWRSIQLPSFGFNVGVFGYVSWRMFYSERRYTTNASLEDKERRLYLIVICFLIPAVGGMMKIALPKNIRAISLGTLLICSQGLVNAVAMNEKMVHEYVKHKLKAWRKTDTKSNSENPEQPVGQEFATSKFGNWRKSCAISGAKTAGTRFYEFVKRKFVDWRMPRTASNLMPNPRVELIPQLSVTLDLSDANNPILNVYNSKNGTCCNNKYVQ
eukprot:Phypoly_transcript_07468.p1 GENE.Phypoly_transcript_07468~~Phypoly_transcript_07468.p1  ORF type:complete len:358 (+),score=24.09 Phypoly_transcript_07468:558-1631(+)